MKQYKLLGLILITCLLSGCLTTWTKEQKQYGAMFTGLSIIDWGQTRDIVEKSKDDCTYGPAGSWHCNYSRYERANFILGPDPSMDQVDTYFPLAITAILATAHYLPKYRTNILKWATILEIGIIHGNYQIGLDINF